MTSSISRPGLVDMFLDNNERYETYQRSETLKSMERIYNYIQTYKTGFSDGERESD